MSFLTCFWDLPQKLHFTRSLDSPNLATGTPAPLRHARGLRDLGQVAGAQHLVDHSVVLGLVCAHDEIPIRVALDLVDRLTGVQGKHLVDEISHPEDLLGLQLDVARLASGTTIRLMQEDPGMRQGEALAL